MTDPYSLARRLEGEADFLASALAEFARRRGLDDEALAGYLGCPPERLGSLRLCRLPAEAPAEFRRDVGRIAERFGVDGRALAGLLNQLRVMRQSPGPGRARFAAARDRPPGEGEA